MKKLLLLSFLNFSLFGYIGIHMDNDDVGYGIAGSYESEDYAGGDTETTISIAGNYFMKENIEFVFSIANSNYSDKMYNGDYDASIGRYSVGGFYHLRDKTMPFNIRFGGEFSEFSMDADYLDELGYKLEGNASSFGGMCYKEITQNESFKMTGFIGYDLRSFQSTLSDSYNNTIEESDDSNLLTFGVGLLFSSNLLIQPRISKSDDDDSSFDVTFGYIIK